MPRPPDPRTRPRRDWRTLRVPHELHHSAKVYARTREIRLQDLTVIALKHYLDAKAVPTFLEELQVYIKHIEERLSRWDRPGAEMILLEMKRKMFACRD
jgi:hypothetical protein